MLVYPTVWGLGCKRGNLPDMAVRSPTFFAGAFLCMAIAYSVYFNVSIRTDAQASQQRFDTLMEINAPRLAASHGERALKLLKNDGASENDLAMVKAAIAEAQLARKDFDRASELMNDALISDWAASLNLRDQINLEDRFARTSVLAGDLRSATSIYASFVELSGDAAIEGYDDGDDSIAKFYADRVAGAADYFAAALNHATATSISGGSRESRLATASHMAILGDFYAMREGGEYAAAGLLSTAYETRKKLLGGDHQETVQIALSLGPLFIDMGRLKNAEVIYHEAFRAQENVKGSNSPELSLYIKLLGGIYEMQGRNTEAQALYELMRGIFRDAFGAQRYSINRQTDRRAYVNRPVSQFFPIDVDYTPTDLVSAAAYSIPTSKAPSIDEMKVRLAPDRDDGMDPREANLPARLAQLISLCRSESDERVSLRSGYRSYQTQRVLHERNGKRGTVTPAGMSEHQTGLAVDINVNGRFMRQSDRAYQCFEENAFRFGFILSYPPNNNYLPGDDSHEPWHWRYVGVSTAQLYREAGPYQKPQEFLAALPCYQERAASGVFPTAGERDICLEGPEPVAVANSGTAGEEKPGNPTSSARILNDQSKGVQSR